MWSVKKKASSSKTSEMNFNLESISVAVNILLQSSWDYLFSNFRSEIKHFTCHLALPTYTIFRNQGI